MLVWWVGWSSNGRAYLVLVSNEWAAYVGEVAGSDSGAAIARRLNVSDSKVSYWKRGERSPTVSEAIRFARVYGRSPFEGLVAAGYLTEDEIPEQSIVVTKSLGVYSDVDLASEMLRRAKIAAR